MQRTEPVGKEVIFNSFFYSLIILIDLIVAVTSSALNTKPIFSIFAASPNSIAAVFSVVEASNANSRSGATGFTTNPLGEI